MFSTRAQPLSETQAYILRKVQGLLIRHKKKQLGENLSSQQLEEIKSETHETAELIARMYNQQIKRLYQLDRKLKASGYKELCSLAWDIPFNGVKTEELDNLSNEVSTFLSQGKSRSEIELNIKNAIQPYAERNPRFIEQQIAQIKQQIIEANQRANAAQQEAAEYKRKYEEAMAALSSSSSSNHVSTNSSSSSLTNQSSSSSDGSRVNIGEPSAANTFWLYTTTFDKKRKASSDFKEQEEKKSQSPLRPSGTNTSTSGNG